MRQACLLKNFSAHYTLIRMQKNSNSTHLLLAWLTAAWPMITRAGQQGSYGSLNFDQGQGVNVEDFKKFNTDFKRNSSQNPAAKATLEEGTIREVNLNSLKTTHPEEFRMFSSFFLAGGQGKVFLAAYSEKNLKGPIVVITKLPTDFSRLLFWKDPGVEASLRKIPSQVGLVLMFSEYTDASVPIFQGTRQKLGELLFAGKLDLIMLLTPRVTADKLVHELHHIEQITSGFIERIENELDVLSPVKKDNEDSFYLTAFVFKIIIEHNAYEVQRQFLMTNGFSASGAENKLRGQHLFAELIVRTKMRKMESEGEEKFIQSICKVIRKELPREGPYSGKDLKSCPRN